MKIHDPEDEAAIAMDMQRYGYAIVREPIPPWWGGIGRILESDLLEQWKI